ncbi:MAG: lipoprotein insertase outer membrane protein LolB [Gammaproteobacteria bacterium]
MLAVAGGCAHQSTDPIEADSDRALRAVAQSFSVTGKIGVSNAGKGYNGSLRWRQTGGELDMTVQGPIGIGRTRLYGESDRVEIENARGEVVVYHNPEEALLTHLGFTVPLQALRYWVAGVPDPGMPAGPLVPKSDLPGARRFAQAGWDVEVQALRTYDSGTLPRKLALSKGATRVKLILSTWQVPATVH